MKKQLIEDNMCLVYSLISKEDPSYIGDEDIIQTGMLGLCKAAEKWDESRGNFSTLAWCCIRNEIVNEFRNRAKHHGVLSLDYEVDGEDGERTSFGDFVVGSEDVGYVDVEFDSYSLTEKETQIFEAYKQGLTADEICEIVGCPKQLVWKTMRKIRILRG